MKKMICAAAAFACAGALAQAPDRMPGPAKGSSDRMLLLGADQMPLPPPPTQAAATGPERVRQFMRDVEAVKARQSKGPHAVKVGFASAAVRSGRLIGVAPQGTLVNGVWTGVERYFQIEGAGYWRVAETDMAATGGMFYMNKAAVNTTVGGKPAISVVFTDNSGRRIEEVLWVDGKKLTVVTFAPDIQTKVSVSAQALASELG